MGPTICLTSEKNTRYAEALRNAGAEIRYGDLSGCGALLLPGGGDIDPARYGQENRGSTDIDRERDELEFGLLREALARRLPVLGVCRGCQLLNVAFGGTLHQDIPDHGPIDEKDRLHPSRCADPVLTGLYGESFIVNSWHHQAVDRLGEGFRAVQWAPDGVVEAIRHEELPLFGVQWHPERLREPTDGWRLIARWLADIEKSRLL